MGVQDAYARKKARETAEKTGQTSYSTDGGARTYDTLSGKKIAGGGSNTSISGGIQLPDKPSLPNVSGKSSIVNDDVSSLISTSRPAINRKDIEKQVKGEFSSARSALSKRLESDIDDAKFDTAQEKRALEGQMGTGRRFSSSAQAFIKFVDEENKKKIANLEIQKEEALANFDFKLAQLIDSRIADERQAQKDELAMAIQMYDLAAKQRTAAKEDPAAIASREGTIIDLVQQGFSDPAEIIELINYDDQGNLVGDMTLEEVSDIVSRVQTPRGLASVVYENPTLFQSLSKEQIAEIAPTLQGMGFDFGEALKPAPEPEREIDTYTNSEGKSVAVMYDPGTRQTRQIVLGEEGKDPGAMFEVETGLRKEFEGLQTTKEARTVRNSYNTINSAYQEALNASRTGGSKAAADQALITAFNKMLDPNSVVREGEFARSTQGQSVINRLKGKAEQFEQGGIGLTDGDREAIVSTTERLYEDYVRMHNENALRYRGFARQQGAKAGNVAEFIDTAGIIDAKEAKDGDILIQDGKPYRKQGGEFVELEGAPDVTADDIVEAIREKESGGDYQARGGSGEFGAYQFMPETWQALAQRHLGNANAQMSPENQDKVAKKEIERLLSLNYTPEQIALIWNGGEPKRKAGVNRYGIKYDTGAYADDVLALLGLNYG
jgi:hypothetical protein